MLNNATEGEITMVFGSATIEEVASLIKSKDFRAAEAKAGMLFGLNKDFISALLLSYVKFMAGRYDEAIETGFKAVGMARNKEDNDIAMLLVAAAHVRRGDRADAKYVAKTFARQDSFWAAYLEMIFLLSEGRGKEAAAQIDKLIARNRKLAFMLLEGMVVKKGLKTDKKAKKP